MVVSGSLPMSSAEIASTIDASRRLTSTERICEPRMPVTTISSTCEASAAWAWAPVASAMDEAPASSARVTPEPTRTGFVDWTRSSLPKIFLWPFSPPPVSGAGRIRFQPVAEVPGLPGEPRFK